MKRSKIIWFFLVTVISIAIVFGGFYLFKLKQSINELSINDKAINDFVQNDSLKLISLNYLLENTEDKYTAIRHTPFKIKDLKYINMKYLFQNIELSISQSEKRLNDQIYTTNQFLNYILPYRLRFEKPENWRQLAIDEFTNLYDDDIFVHASNINDELRKTFLYSFKSKENRQLSDLLSNNYGSCFEMSDIAAFSMRANGIPVGVDFAKWSNIRGGHQWNSLILKSQNIPFMGMETNPDRANNIAQFTSDYKKAAKIYRKSFKKYEDSFHKFNPKKVINKQNYIDVTKEYYPDCKNIVIEYQDESLNNEFFFLCVYEVNKWVPVDFTKAKNNLIIFKDVNPNNLFVLKKRLKDSKLEYYKTPLTFDALGKVTFLKTQPENQKRLKLAFDNSNERELIRSMNEIGMTETNAIRESIMKYNNTAKVNNDAEYKLFYWDKKWIFIDKQTVQNDSLVFNNAPANGLYKLEDINNPKSIRNRCFTVDNDYKQYWW